MTVLTRRAALTLAAGAALLPRIALAQGDSRPTLRIAVQKISNSNTLESLREQSNVGTRVLYSIVETLIDIDWVGDLGLRPGLATAWRRIDARTLELTLREGVRFHNGDLMTAEDVAFSFGPERMWSGGGGEGRGMFTSTQSGAGGKLPPPEAPATAKLAYPDFERIEIVDARTVRFVNRTPDVTLEGRLTRNTGVIQSRRAFAEAASWLDWARRPVGTGPYRVRDYRPDRELVLEAFDDYWGGRPPVKAIRFVEVPEVASRVNGLVSGDFDFACDMPPDQIEGVERRGRHQVMGGLIANHRLTVFDKTHPQLADARVRRAMTHAIDRKAIVEGLWLGRTAVPAGMQWPFFGEMALADWDVPRFDPEEAKRLLRESGYRGDPIPFRLLNNYYTNQVATAQVLVEGWKAVGLNVAIEMKENWGQILDRNGARAVRDNSNTAPFNDPVGAMAAWGPGGQQWETGEWRNEESGRMLAELATSTDLERRRRAYRRMLEICEREDPAYTVLHQTVNLTGGRKDVPWKSAQSFVMDFSPRNWRSNG